MGLHPVAPRFGGYFASHALDRQPATIALPNRAMMGRDTPNISVKPKMLLEAVIASSAIFALHSRSESARGPP